MVWTDLPGKPGWKQDEAGNLLQPAGGIVPKACQHCGEEFNAPVKETKIIQNAPLYKCNSCGFENTSADPAWDHEKQFESLNHKVRKVSIERVAGFERRITGKIARISFSEIGDAKVLCDDCLEAK